MARTRLEIKDSIGAFLRDLGRIGKSGEEVMAQELSTSIAQIIEGTPVSTGAAAGSWLYSLQKLGGDKANIEQREWPGLEYSGRSWRRSGWLKRTRPRPPLTVASGLRLGYFFRTQQKSKLTLEAGSAAYHYTFIEYGVANPRSNGKWSGYARPPLHLVRNAVKAMKQRIGPALIKAMRAMLKRPKRYKRGKG